jgi:hypothetical protein
LADDHRTGVLLLQVDAGFCATRPSGNRNRRKPARVPTTPFWYDDPKGGGRKADLTKSQLSQHLIIQSHTRRKHQNETPLYHHPTDRTDNDPDGLLQPCTARSAHRRNRTSPTHKRNGTSPGRQTRHLSRRQPDRAAGRAGPSVPDQASRRHLRDRGIRQQRRRPQDQRAGPRGRPDDVRRLYRHRQTANPRFCQLERPLRP